MRKKPHIPRRQKESTNIKKFLYCYVGSSIRFIFEDVEVIESGEGYVSLTLHQTEQVLKDKKNEVAGDVKIPEEFILKLPDSFFKSFLSEDMMELDLLFCTAKLSGIMKVVSIIKYDIIVPYKENPKNPEKPLPDKRLVHVDGDQYITYTHKVNWIRARRTFEEFYVVVSREGNYAVLPMALLHS